MPYDLFDAKAEIHELQITLQYIIELLQEKGIIEKEEKKEGKEDDKHEKKEDKK